MIRPENVLRKSNNAALIEVGWVIHAVGEFTRSSGLCQSILKDAFSGNLFLQNEFYEPASAPLDCIPQKRSA